MTEDPTDSVDPSPAPTQESFTAGQVAEQTGATLEQATRLWRALGFPEAGDEAIFGAEDVTALRRLIAVIDTGVIDFDLGINLARGMGQSMARLSDWQATALLHRLEEAASAEGSAEGSAVDQASLLAVAKADIRLRHDIERLLIYVWRRHFDAALRRIEASLAGEIGTTRLTVGFADIVSFTALSNTLTEERIGDLVERFEARCADVVARQRGRIIKSMGDAVLFVNDDPLSAYDTAEGIINVIGRDPRMPDVRVGLASGSVVTRLGDVFGPPVNMAARLTAVARRNRIIADEATAELLPADLFEVRRLPARPVRGFGVIEPVALSRR